MGTVTRWLLLSLVVVLAIRLFAMKRGMSSPWRVT